MNKEKKETKTLLVLRYYVTHAISYRRNTNARFQAKLKINF